MLTHLNPKSSYDLIKSCISIYWLVGFIECSNCFNLVLEQDKFILEFIIKVKDEQFLLMLIKKLLHISNKIIIGKDNQFVLKTTQSRAISNVIKLFSSKDYKFKGVNSFKFNLWKKVYARLHKITFHSKDLKRIEKIYKIIVKHNKKS